MPAKPTGSTADAGLTQTLLALLSLVLSILQFSTALTAMYLTCRAPRGLGQAITMILVASTLCIVSFFRLLAVGSRHQDRSPSQIALHLLSWTAKHAHIVLGVYIGGLLAGFMGWIIGAIVAVLLPILFLSPSDRFKSTTLRGTVLIAAHDAEQRCDKLTAPGEPTINLAGHHLPDRFSEQHFLMVGATGAGKTVALRLLMQSVLLRILLASDYRALIYDPKQDMMEILSGLSLPCEIIVLNPFDARSVAWDMAKDITTPASAIQIASIFIEEEKGHNAFFAKAARDLFAAVMIALHNTRPGDWTLADVVTTLSSTDMTRQLLEAVPYTRLIAEEHFGRQTNTTTANVQYTISANIAYLRPIAALWEKAARRFSLQEWIDGNSILLLGNSETLRTPIDAINRAIFQRLVELVLAQSESSTRRTWFFLDELKEMGRLDALPSLLTKGRSKGARVAIMFQTVEGLRAVYGDRLANEIAGMCACKLLLRTDSPETAQWASSVIGEAETLRWIRSHQNGKNGESNSLSQQIITTQAVLASELLRLPLANRECFHSYCIVPAIGIWRSVTRFAHDLLPKGAAANFVPRPDTDQYPVCPLNDDDDDQRSLNNITRMTWKHNLPTYDQNL